MKTECELVLLIKTADDEHAFHMLYNQWSGKLYNFVMRVSNGDKALAEEIVQGIFVSVWEKRATLDESKSFGNYICTMAKNSLINIYKHRMVESIYRRMMKCCDEKASDSTNDDIDSQSLHSLLDSIVEKLPDARRNIFKLKYFECKTNKEIASMLHLSENTVESQITKALKFVRQRVEKHYLLLVVTVFSVW